MDGNDVELVCMNSSLLVGIILGVFRKRKEKERNSLIKVTVESVRLHNT